MPERELPWPLRYLVDAEGRDTGFAMLRGPIMPHQQDAFERMSSSHRMIGFTHFGTFPLLHPAYDPSFGDADPQTGWDRPEVLSCEAWCHCFREPDLYLPPDKPRVLITGSDWVDRDEVSALAHEHGRPAKRWDVVYTCLSNWHNDVRKNWSLAKACIEALVRELDVSVLLIGRAGLPDVPRSSNIDVRARVRWGELLANTAAARLVLVPNRLDPSPRLLAEAVALDVPVVVNDDILGGWKYVNDTTGVMFRDEHDVVEAAFGCLAADPGPGGWWAERYGRDLSSRRLAESLRSLGGADDLEYAFPCDWLAE